MSIFTRIWTAPKKAGEGNRTLVVGLGSRCSTIELHPRRIAPFYRSRFSSQWWLLLTPGGLQSRVDEEKFCHRVHRGHREPLVFRPLCSLCSLWLIPYLFGFSTLQFSCCSPVRESKTFRYLWDLKKLLEEPRINALKHKMNRCPPTSQRRNEPAWKNLPAFKQFLVQRLTR